jgi:hypothetical protein
MRIQVHGIEGIADLADDLRFIPRVMRHRAGAVVARNIEYGNRVAQREARAAAGPHGKDYFKRLSAEMTGSLSGEYGPEGPPKSDYVGVDGTAGATRDLDASAAKTAPRFARDIGRMVDGLFWP